MEREHLTLPAQIANPSSLSQRPSLTPGLGGGKNGNRRGIEVEERVATLLATLPDVTNIRTTEQNSTEDQALTDLVVDLSEPFQEAGIDQVNVQVKASSHTYGEFRRSLKRRLNRLGLDSSQVGKDQYLVDNHIIVLIGGERETKTTPREVVPDERIIADFSQQLNTIVEAKKSKLSGE
jgi:hypothetical protein